MATKRTSESYKDRDRCLLELAARDRVLLPPVVAAVFGNGKPIPHALNRLAQEGLLQAFPRALPGGLSYYVISTKGCAAIGAPAFRATPPQGAALDSAIATTYFCHLGDRRRYRLDPQEIDGLLEFSAPSNVPFVIGDEPEGRVVMRVVHGGSRLAPDAVRQLRVLFAQACSHPKLRSWIAARQFGFALLGPTTASVASLERLIERSELRKECRIVVELGPDAEHLAAALKHRRGR